MNETTEQPLTLQEAFDQVWQAFVVEKRPKGMNSERETCVYRGPKGERCAFGLLLRDDEYTPGMEGNGVLTLYQSNQLPKRFRPIVDLLADLQEAHDASELSEFHEAIEARLRNAATAHDLNIPGGAA